MTGTAVIVRVEDELKTAFAQAAKAADRTVSQLLRNYVREQAEHDAWRHRKVAAARAVIATGKVLPAEEAEAQFAERRAQSLRRAAASDR